MDRMSNYEGVTKKFGTNAAVTDHHRYYLMQQLTPDAQLRLESQCSSLFLSCIDFDLTTYEDAMLAYDKLYTIYCQKFSFIDMKEEEGMEKGRKGIYSLIDKVQEQSPIQNKRVKSQEVFSILKIIFGIFTVILTVMYYTGIYFSIFDEEAEKKAKLRK